MIGRARAVLQRKYGPGPGWRREAWWPMGGRFAMANDLRREGMGGEGEGEGP